MTQNLTTQLPTGSCVLKPDLFLFIPKGEYAATYG